MTQPALVENAKAMPSESAGESSWMPRPASLAEQFSDNLSNIASGIVLAGAIYPALLGICYPVFAIVLALSSQATWKEVLQSLVATVVVGTFGAGIGLVYAATVAVVVLPVAYLVVRSLGMHGSIIRFGAFCGGLVGFVGASPFLIAALNMRSASETAVAVLVGPVLATIVGQVGGAWGGWQVGKCERAIASLTKDLRSALSSDTEEPEQAGEADHRRMRFGIRHLLIVSVWISLLLTAIRLSGLDFAFVLILLTVWAVFQAGTLWLGERLIRVRARFRQRLQTRST